MKKILTILNCVIISILSIWCTYNTIDVITIHSWYEIMIGYIALILPAALVLLITSKVSYKKLTNQLSQRFAKTGLIISKVTILIPLLQIFYYKILNLFY